jgi:hypothetical protein
LELELKDRTVEADVTPLDAAVVGFFEQKGGGFALFRPLALRSPLRS